MQSANQKTLYAVDDLQNAARDLAGKCTRAAAQHTTDADTREKLRQWAAQINEISNRMAAEVSILEGVEVIDAIVAGEY